MAIETIEYNEKIQKIFLQYLVTEDDLWIRSNNIIEISYFHRNLRPVIRLMKEFAEKHNGLPRLEQIEAATDTALVPLENLTDIDRDWFLQHIEQFCKRRALEEWLNKGVDYVKEGRHGSLEQGLKDAMSISLYANLGTSYYAEPKARLLALEEMRGGITTGWTDFDKVLDGGMSFGELHIFAGGSGSGKSIWLQNMALNMSQQGLHVAYITLELSEEMIGQRIDAMVTGYSTNDVMRRKDDVDIIVKRAGKNAGEIWFKDIPHDSNVNDIKAYLKELEIRMGLRPDVLIVDYLDIVAPNDTRIDPANLSIKDKFVSQEMRGLAREGLGPDHRLLCITASQLNRDAVEATEHNHSHIAGGKTKIDAADGVYSIHTSLAKRNKGEYTLQFMKTRNSNGEGRYIKFAYDVDSMRISDFDGDAEVDMHDDSIMDKLKANTNSANIAAVAAVTKPSRPNLPAPSTNSSVIGLIESVQTGSLDDLDDI